MTDVQTESEVLLYQKAEKGADVSKCGGCGATLKYQPEKECLECEHCGFAQSFSTRPSYKLPFHRITDEGDKWTETHVFRCSNCGAKEIISRNDIAKSCSFCGTTSIVETEELSGLKPNAVLPFKLSKESAVERVIRWAKRKFFAPKRFKKSVCPQEVDGIYNPAFLFDTNTFTRYEGRLSKTTTYTTTVKGKSATRTKVEYKNISGSYNGSYVDVLIQAATQIKQKDINKIQPFMSAEAKEYDGNFLYGYTANQYEKDGILCWDEARNVIDNRIKGAILASYPGWEVVSFRAETNYNDLMFSYTLLPVYVGHTTYNKKLYNFYVNGANGKVTGKTPVSPGKVTLVAGIILAVAAAAVVGITKALGMW